MSRQVLFRKKKKKILFIKLTLSGPYLKKYCYVKNYECLLTLQVNRMYLGKYNKYNFFIGHKSPVYWLIFSCIIMLKSRY